MANSTIPTNVNIPLFDVLQDDVNTNEIADSVILYFAEIANDMKLDDGADLPNIQSYVEQGELQAEAAMFFEELLDAMKRQILSCIKSRKVRLANVKFDTTDAANPGTVAGFEVVVNR